jgi:hypothetical protein
LVEESALTVSRERLASSVTVRDRSIGDSQAGIRLCNRCTKVQ